MSKIVYQLRPSRSRRRVIRLAIHADGSIVVTASRAIPPTLIENFVQGKSAWIERQQKKMRTRPSVPLQGDREEYELLRGEALAFVEERLKEICAAYRVTYQALRISNTRTRWGSCTRHGRLMIHYKILFLPLDVAEYLLVHEVCHLKEMNHSPRFWKHVSELVPEYIARRRALRHWLHGVGAARV